MPRCGLGVPVPAGKYVPGIYWLTVVLISIVGTLITDNLVDNLGVSLVVSTTIFAVALAVTFTAWYAGEGMLSIHSIRTPRREAFYWPAILFTFALGTAAGDVFAEHLNLGYWKSAGRSRDRRRRRRAGKTYGLNVAHAHGSHPVTRSSGGRSPPAPPKSFKSGPVSRRRHSIGSSMTSTDLTPIDSPRST